MNELRVFFGCASAHLPRLQEIIDELRARMNRENVTLVERTWDAPGVIASGRSVLDALAEEASLCEAAVLDISGALLGPEDRFISNANVIFEVGYFRAKFNDEMSICLISHRSVDRLTEFPSDLDGVTRATFDTPSEAAGKIWDQFRKRAPTPPPSHPIDHKEPEPFRQVVPIYRDLTSDVSWASAVRQQIAGGARVRSELVYQAPGQAYHWTRSTRNSRVLSAMGSTLSAVLSSHLPTLLPWATSGGGLSFVDLGVGNLARLAGPFQAFFGHFWKEGMPVDYFPVDISYEMLEESLRSTAAAPEHFLSEVVRHKGRIAGINGPFVSMERFAKLLLRDRPALFCLLGNTLGNEPVHTQTDLLRGIWRAMGPHDYLLLEVLGTPTVSIHDLDAAISLGLSDEIQRKFYLGPLLQLGARPGHFDVSSRTVKLRDDPKDPDHPCCETEVIARTRRLVRLENFLDQQLDLGQGTELSIYLVRWYSAAYLTTVCEDSGFEVVNFQTRRIESPARNLHYALLRKTN